MWSKGFPRRDGRARIRRPHSTETNGRAEPSYPAALSRIHKVAAPEICTYAAVDDPGVEDCAFKEWAAINKARIIQQTHEDDPSVAIQAYEDYLGGETLAKADGEPQEREFANLAKAELGHLHTLLGNYDIAEQYLTAALQEQEHVEVRDMAQKYMQDLTTARGEE